MARFDGAGWEWIALVALNPMDSLVRGRPKAGWSCWLC